MGNVANPEKFTDIPKEIALAIEEYGIQKDFAVELHNDLAKIFNSPVLDNTLVQLVNYVEEYTTARELFMSAGYTLQDAYTILVAESGG